MHTHYLIDSDGRVKIFTPEKCENCGAIVEAPNSVHLANAQDRSRFQEWQGKPPAEQWFDENAGLCVCDYCWR